MTNAERYAAIKAVLDVDHPTSGAWDVDDILALAQAKAEDIVRDRLTIPSVEILNYILETPSEWNALTDSERQMVGIILDQNREVPTSAGTPARAALIAILGTTQKAAIAAAIPETVSIEATIDAGAWSLGDIQNARAL